jgi:hypothetical protein
VSPCRRRRLGWPGRGDQTHALAQLVQVAAAACMPDKHEVLRCARESDGFRLGPLPNDYERDASGLDFN